MPRKNIVKSILTNIWLVTTIAVVVVLISAMASYQTHHWHWFGRSGSILTILGILLTIRPMIRMGLRKWIDYQSIIDGGNFVQTEEEKEANHQEYLDSIALKIGAIFSVVGTIIWAYGDLIECIF